MFSGRHQGKFFGDRLCHTDASHGHWAHVLPEENNNIFILLSQVFLFYQSSSCRISLSPRNVELLYTAYSHDLKINGLFFRHRPLISRM